MAHASTPSLPARKRAGSPLVGVLMILFLASAVVMGLIAQSVGSVRLTRRQTLLETAHFAAEAGLELAGDWIAWAEGYVPRDNTLTLTLPNGATVVAHVTVNNLDTMDCSVESSGTFQGVTRRLIIDRTVRPTFAQYGFWTTDFRNLWFIPGDIERGWAHSDNLINIWSSAGTSGPDFYDWLTTGAPSFGGPWENAHFHKGYEFLSDQGSMSTVNFPNVRSKALGMQAAHEGGLVLEGASDVFFHVNPADERGWISVRNSRKYGDTAWHDVSSEGLSLVYVRDAAGGPTTNRTGTLALYGGVLDGSLSFYAEGDVTIRDSIVYKNDPGDDHLPVEQRDYAEASDDRLGVISMDDVFLDRRWIGRGDMLLYGAYMATGLKSGSAGQMGLLDYANRVVGPLGILSQYGSFVMKRVYPYGVFNGSNGALLSGFTTHNRYDARFIDGPPPFYPPLSQRLRFEGWHYARSP